MGQYWHIYNLDKMEELGLYGVKMGEWFFTACTTHIVQSLARHQMLSESDYRIPLSGSWAGDRIVCLGDYSRVYDLPPGLFSMEELKKLGYKEEEVEYHSSSEDEDWDHAKRVAVARKVEYLSIYNRLGARVTDKRLPSRNNDYSHYVLRNLCKKEYIRGGPSVRALEERDGCFPDIGQKFFSLICWSSDSTVNMFLPDDVDLSRGRWAGDRFDLVYMDDVEEELEGDGWNDISTEVEETLARIKSANTY